MPSVRAIPPSQTQDQDERALGSTRENIGPLVRALRSVRGGTAPFRLDRFPPFGHLGAKTGDRDRITPRRLVSVLEILLDNRWPTLGRKSRTL